MRVCDHAGQASKAKSAILGKQVENLSSQRSLQELQAKQHGGRA